MLPSRSCVHKITHSQWKLGEDGIGGQARGINFGCVG